MELLPAFSGRRSACQPSCLRFIGTGRRSKSSARASCWRLTSSSSHADLGPSWSHFIGLAAGAGAGRAIARRRSAQVFGNDSTARATSVKMVPRHGECSWRVLGQLAQPLLVTSTQTQIKMSSAWVSSGRAGDRSGLQNTEAADDRAPCRTARRSGQPPDRFQLEARGRARRALERRDDAPCKGQSGE